MSTLLQSFQAAYRNLEIQPLVTPKELDQLRVSYGDRVIEELVQLLSDRALLS
jgi:hypothetical protein